MFQIKYFSTFDISGYKGWIFLGSVLLIDGACTFLRPIKSSTISKNKLACGTTSWICLRESGFKTAKPRPTVKPVNAKATTFRLDDFLGVVGTCLFADSGALLEVSVVVASCLGFIMEQLFFFSLRL